MTSLGHEDVMCSARDTVASGRHPLFESSPDVSTCGSEAGSYLRLIDFVYHSILGLRVIKKKKRSQHLQPVQKVQ